MHQFRETTQKAIDRQIAAMGGRRFDMLLREAMSGMSLQKERSTNDMLRNVSWLRRMNARRHNNFIRPSGEHGLVLLGPLKDDGLEKMRRDSLVPGVGLEITLDEFEAWIKLSHGALPAPLRRLAEMELMGLIVDARKETVNDVYGRLAGFVNLGNDLDDIWRTSHVLAFSGNAGVSQSAKVCLERARTLFEDRNKDNQSNISVLDLPNQAKRSGHRR